MTAPSHACPACATLLPEAAVFCPRCGAATPASDRAAPASAGDEERLRTALAERYRLEREIGRGGNAVVYLAHDLRHKRPVAIKVLMPELALSVRASRFLREIEIAAKLNHPHILPLLDSGDTDGFLYYVMPYVEGESVRERLRRERQLSIADALQIAREVADALAFAHGRDVVHRDIKPENILLQAGHAVVADFGIARALTAASGRTVTEAGIAVGTPTYMSPEQGSGEAYVDGRSDIYSLGCVLYEMLAGHAPFTGASVQEILARHSLDPVPSLRAARPGTPEALEQVVVKALAKAPADRFATAAEFARALSAGSIPRPVRLRGARRWAAASLGLLGTGFVLIAVVLVVFLVKGRPWAAPVAAAHHTQLTFEGNVINAEISPDGELLGYISEVGDIHQLVVRDLKGTTTIRLASVGSRGDLRWSPDGSVLLYAGADSLGRPVTETFPRLGGAARPLPYSGGYGAWSPEGSRVAQWRDAVRPPSVNRIVLTTLATGDTMAIPVPDSLGFLGSGEWSPTGKLIALLTVRKSRARAALWTVAVDGSGWHRLAEDTVSLSPPRWAPAGDGIYYLGKDELRKIQVSSDGRATGEPKVVQTGLQWPRAWFNGVSMTADGRKLVYTRSTGSANLWLAATDRAEKGARFITTQLTRGTTSKKPPRPSPDGRWLAFVQEQDNRPNIFTLPIDGGEPRQITFTGAAYSIPVWSPDGRGLAFCANVGGVIKVRTVDVGSGRERTYERTEAGPGCQLAWGPGRRILYQRPGNRNFHLLDPATEAEAPLVANDSVGWMFYPVYSPDGERVAVAWNRHPHGVWVIALKDSSQVLVHGGRSGPVGWSADGRSVYVEDGTSGDILRVSATGGAATTVAKQPFDNADCAAIERRSSLALVCWVEESIADAWMIENFDPDLR